MPIQFRQWPIGELEGEMADQNRKQGLVEIREIFSKSNQTATIDIRELQHTFTSRTARSLPGHSLGPAPKVNRLR